MSRTLTSFRPSAAIAAVIVAGAVLASCSSGSDDQSSQSASTSSESTSSESNSSESKSSAAPTSEYPAGSPEAAIAQISEDYLAAVSSGKFDAVVAVSCQKMVDTIPEGEEGVDSPPLPQPIVLDNVENVAIDGDSATADVTASVEDSAETPPQTESLVFVNEDGWKICQ